MVLVDPYLKECLLDVGSPSYAVSSEPHENSHYVGVEVRTHFEVSIKASSVFVVDRAVED
jgi:hypothetical protein